MGKRTPGLHDCAGHGDDGTDHSAGDATVRAGAAGLVAGPRRPAHPRFGRCLDNASYHISLSLSIPIFTSFSARNNVRSYRIARRRAEYDYRIMQKNLDKEIRQAYIDAVGAYEQYGAAARNVATSEESFRMMEEKYTLGAA